MKNNLIDLDFTDGLKVDRVILTLISCLFLLGFIAVFSASKENVYILSSHITKSVLGVVAFILISRVNIVYFAQMTSKLYLAVVVLLVMVALVGETRMGATRWLDIGIFSFQPSELAKLTIPLMCSLIVFKYGLFTSARNIALALSIITLPSLLIFKQPDLGTAIMVAASGGAVLLFAGFSLRLLAGGALSLSLASPLIWMYALKPYQKKRVEAVLNPESDPLGAGYHVIQSKSAIGAGGVDGVGWLEGTQTHLGFIPEQHTDFIFSAIGEEFGFMGALLLIGLYLLLMTRLLVILLRIDSLFGKAFISSVLFTIFAYVFVNIGMVVGLLPVVGVPLPLISYGGTATLTLMISLGIVSAFSIQSKTKH